MKNWYLTLTRGKQIILAVLAGHGLVLFFLVFQHWISSVPPKRKHIAINTIRLEAPPKKSVIASVAPKPAIVKPVASQVSTKKEASKKGTVKASPSAKPTKVEQEKKGGPKREEMALLREIEAGLTTITAPAQIKRQEIDVPTLSSNELVLEESPTEIIAAFLQEMLQLPEFGEVKVHLVLDRNGKLESLEIVDSKSEKNAEFLKNQLPELLFPCLNKVVNLTIVFSNAL